MNTRRSRINANERIIDKYLETNDNNWYKLCRNEITWKQTDIDDYISKDNKVEQIKFRGM